MPRADNFATSGPVQASSEVAFLAHEWTGYTLCQVDQKYRAETLVPGSRAVDI